MADLITDALPVDLSDVPLHTSQDLADAVEQAIADSVVKAVAAERDAIIQLAVDHGAIYLGEPRPCPCKRDCHIPIRDRIPFADLIRKERN